MKCSFKKCENNPFKNHGNTSYCLKHYRLMLISIGICNSNYNKRFTLGELDTIFDENMICSICNKNMIFHRLFGKAKDVVTVQHWTEKDISFMCMECNSRHGASDNPNVLNISKNLKWCPHCKIAKNKNQFHKDNTRGDGLSGICKNCKSIKMKQI